MFHHLSTAAARRHSYVAFFLLMAGLFASACADDPDNAETQDSDSDTTGRNDSDSA
ncbi:MAG: hypothetical protein JXX29_00465 [Deltaproteobacteria bacterium]|nr:hypothetical protein [Deltaproteobacteria bacterium]MBN2670109.1 hypothetical protein [Deltaproteobacteria bacterium]